MRLHSASILSAAGFGALALLLLVCAGQPLITDDAWLHLALGKAYATQGLWLSADPLLASSPGPPTPAAWLFDVVLFALERTVGFVGLRVTHVMLVAANLAGAWWLLRRASGTLLVANLASGLWITLAAYRLIQLRPHLFTILATLLLYHLLLAREAPASRKRVALVVLLLGVWANVHAAFLLGPLLLGGALCGLLAAVPLRSRELRKRDLARAIPLATAAAAGSLATLLNPSGIEPHLAWFVAGRDTPSLGRVADEWTGLDLLALPIPSLPPSLLTWLIFWILLIATGIAVAHAVRTGRSGDPAAQTGQPIDPALVGISLVSLALPLIGVRFLWLGIFPLLLISQVVGRWLSVRRRGRPPASWIAVLLTLLLLPAFVLVGPWTMIGATVPNTWFAYRLPYHAGKYHAHQVWMLEDTGLRGTAFAEYHMGGFIGFHRAPDIRMLVNGTLNVTPAVAASNLALRLRRSEREGERFTELLDRHEIDIFVGIRLPRLPGTTRLWFYTTGHLERTPGWIPVFRNLTGAVYLRTNERNRANLDRVADYYADQGIPFDRDRGFDPEQAVREARGWATRHALIPMDFDRISAAAYGSDPQRKVWARGWLASIYAALGLYELAIEIDGHLVESEADAPMARRRLVWCLLRAGRVDEAAAAAVTLEQGPNTDALSRMIAKAARRVSETTDEEVRAEIVARLPVFTVAEAGALTTKVMGPPARVPQR